jgi:hypothetical protein
MTGLAIDTLIFGAFWLWLLALFPAAIVTVLKGRWLFFVTGWLLLGITWFIGALTLADPDSDWARRFYGEERLARAADPIRHPRPHRVTALWLSGSLALLLAIGLLAARPTPVIGVDGRALQYSVGGGNLGFPTQPCRHDADGAWSCTVWDNGYSSTVAYRVKVHHLGCWTATRAGWSAEGSAKRLSGCITVWDHFRLLDGAL